MIGFNYHCRKARSNLLRQDQMDAVQRGKLDIHLRRCEACRRIAQDLAILEHISFDNNDLGEQQRLDIYSWLVPAVHEIATKPEPEPSNLRRYFEVRPGFALGAVFAAVLVLLALFMFFETPEPEVASSPTAKLAPQIRKPNPVTRDVLVARHEGLVLIDDVKVQPAERARIRIGSRISVDKNGRFSFSIKDMGSFALFADTKWNLVYSSETHLSVRLDRGSLAAQFDARSGKVLEITTPDSLVRVKGTVFTVEVLPEEGTRVGVVQGSVEVVTLRGQPKSFELERGQVANVPGDGVSEPLSEVQRALSREVERIEELPAELTRLVRFEGSPERVKVEVGGRVIGTTPLAIRLPEGKLAYKLTSPGMEPVAGVLKSDRGPRKIEYSMIPTEHADDADFEMRPRKRWKKRAEPEVEIPAEPEKTISWDFFSRARAAMTAGDIPYAIGLLNRSLEEATGKKRIESLSLLAECHSAMGSYAKAADLFDIIAEELPRTETAQNARYEVGRLSMDQLGDLSRARAAFTAYVASPLGGPLREEAFYSLCQIDGREGSHRDAFYCFNEFLRTFPGGHNEPDARLWRGALYQDLDRRFADAERDLLFFLKRRPNHPRTDEALYRVIVGRYSVGDERGAMRMITEYLKAHPKGRFRVRVERLKRAILENVKSTPSATE